MSTGDSLNADRSPRVRPGPGPAALVLAAYALVVVGIEKASGIPYDEWFDSGSHVMRAPFPAFAAGAVMLLGTAVWLRWDGVWRDRVRVSMGFSLWLPVVLLGSTVLLLLADADWTGHEPGLVAAVAVTTLLVGLCEELLFRGLVLRGLREQLREAVAALVVAGVFGLFHYVNLFLGAGVASTTQQVVSAAIGGVGYYLLRRGFGLLVVPVAVHGLYDLAISLAPEEQGILGMLAGLLGLPTLLATTVAVAVLVARGSPETAADAVGRSRGPV